MEQSFAVTISNITEQFILSIAIIKFLVFIFTSLQNTREEEQK